MQGTSMATPLIAGSAALVRQYFQNGLYPTGAPIASNQYSPSGPLVKAVLIGGAAGLSGFEPDTGLPLAPPPSFRQGFGRLQLSQSLPLQVISWMARSSLPEVPEATEAIVLNWSWPWEHARPFISYGSQGKREHQVGPHNLFKNRANIDKQ